MEFFSEISPAAVTIDELQQQLQIASLPSLCASIDTVISEQGGHGEIYCLWGQFTVSRQLIRNGVRFALLECPHALAWTVTLKEDINSLVVHCTIDDQQTEAEFAETIELFVEDWANGLKKVFSLE